MLVSDVFQRERCLNVSMRAEINARPLLELATYRETNPLRVAGVVEIW